MKPFVIVRKYEKRDDLASQDVVKDFIMSGVFDAFLNCLIREITLQLIVLVWAFLFIFVGFPLYLCFLAAPGVIIFTLLSVYATFFGKAAETAMLNNGRTWVAEVYEPYIQQLNTKDIEYNFIKDDSIKAFDLEINKMKKSIVGTISVESHHSLHTSGWIYRLAVHPKYPFDCIAEELIKNVLQFAVSERWNSVESVTTECQWETRDLFTKMGFTMRLIYHKPIMGNAIKIMKSQLGYDLIENGSDRDKLH